MKIINMKSITPCLWFSNEAEEAANFYVSVFKDGKIGKTMRHDESSAKASGQPAGSVVTVEFEIMGQKFMGLNGGPIFKFSEVVSFVIDCKDQAEIDYYWDTLIADGGAESQCGWLKDKYGLSWQVVPTFLDGLLTDPDPVKAGRAMKAMLEMKKLDVQALQNAYDGV